MRTQTFVFKTVMGNALQQIDMGLIGVTDKIIGMISFIKSLWKRLLDIYLTPVIIKLDNTIFRQRIWIPLALMKLHSFYFTKAITMVKKRSIRQARRLANVFIFIDDIVAVSGGGEFEWGFKEIYPPEVIIEKENLIMKNIFWIYL